MPTVHKKTKLPATYRAGFLRELDGRTELASRLRDSYTAILDDLGEENLSHVKLTLVERYVFLEELLRSWELKIATDPLGSTELAGKWVQAINSLLGLSKILGLKRQPRQVESLTTYAKKKRGAA